MANNSNELKSLLATEATKRGILKPKDRVLIIGGSLLVFPAKANLLQTMEVDEILMFGQQLGDTIDKLRDKIGYSE